MDKVTQTIEILKSWEKGYLAPSAQMAMKDAREIIELQESIIMDLQQQIKALEEKADGHNKEIEESDQGSKQGKPSKSVRKSPRKV